MGRFSAIPVAFGVALAIVAACNRQPERVAAPQQAGKEVAIGAVLSLTGDKAAYGQSAQQGISLAVDEINENHLIPGTKLRIVFEDGRGSARDAVSAFQKLVDANRVPAVLGPLTSSEVLAIAPIAEQRKVILFTPAASAPAITTAGDYVFRNCPSDLYEGAAMAEVARTRLKLGKIAVLYVNSDYGIGVLDVFREKLTELGGTIVDAESFDDGAKDFRTQLLKIRRAAADAVYFIGYKELGLMVRQAKQVGVGGTYLSTALFEDPDVLQTAGPAAENVIFTSITFAANRDDARSNAFVAAYRERYGNVPDSFAAISYDAAHILAEAIRARGSSPDQIKSGLYAIKSYPGLLGSTSFDSNGDVTLPVALKTVRNGQFVAFQ